MRFLRSLIHFAAGATATSISLKEALEQESSLSILHDLLKQFDLLQELNTIANLTLFAPTNQAYLDLARWGFNVSEVDPTIARALLRYHAVAGLHPSTAFRPGAEPRVLHTLLQPPILSNVSDGAAVKLSRAIDDGIIVTESGLQVVGGVVKPDIQFENGVIHSINSSLVLPHNISTTAVLGGLTGFLEAVEAVDLVSELESQSDVTLFIPHNAAMQKMRTMMKLLSRQQRANVLRYHVVPGQVLYKQQVRSQPSSFTSLLGSPVAVQARMDGSFYVNDAKIVRQDLLIYGGVAHIIDEMLVPEAKSVAIQPSAEQTGMTFTDPLRALPAQRVDDPAYGSGLAPYLHISVTFALAMICLVLCVLQRRTSAVAKRRTEELEIESGGRTKRGLSK